MFEFPMNFNIYAALRNLRKCLTCLFIVLDGSVCVLCSRYSLSRMTTFVCLLFSTGRGLHA